MTERVITHPTASFSARCSPNWRVGVRAAARPVHPPARQGGVRTRPASPVSHGHHVTGCRVAGQQDTGSRSRWPSHTGSVCRAPSRLPGLQTPAAHAGQSAPATAPPPSTNTHSERSRAPGERRFKHPRARCPENQENALLGCTAESRRPSAASPGRTAVLAGARGRRVTSRGRVPQGPQTLQRHGHRRWHRGSTASGRVVSRPGLRDGAPEHSRRGPLARALA